MSRSWFSAYLIVGVLVVGAGFAFWPKPDPDIVWLEARQLMAEKAFPEADRTLTRLAKLRAPTTLDWLLRAQVAMAMNRIDEAFSDLEHVPDSEPLAAAQARLQAGQLELRRNRARYAEKYLRKAVELDPKAVQQRRELIFIYGFQLRRPELMVQFRALSILTSLTYDDAFLWCLTRGAEWEPSEASNWLQKFVDADPDDRESRIALADNRRREQRFDEAEVLLAPLPISDPTAIGIRARIAIDRNDEALLAKILATGPQDNPDLARIRARMAQIDRRTDEAIRLYQIVLKSENDDPESLRGLGQCYFIKGESELAEKYLNQAKMYDKLGGLVMRAAPGPQRNDVELVFNLGKACEAVERFPEALAWYRLILQRDPLDPRAQAAIYRVKAALEKQLSKD